MSEQRYLEIYEQAKAEGDTETATRALEGLRAFRAQAPQSFLGATAETARTMAQNIPVTVGAGLAGVGELITTGDPTQAAETVRGVQEEYSYQPQGQRAIEQMQTLGEAINMPAAGIAGLATLPFGLEQAVETVGQVKEQGIGKVAGENIFQETGSPLAATAMEVLPDVLESAVGMKVAKPVTSTAGGRFVEAVDDMFTRPSKGKQEIKRMIKEGEIDPRTVGFDVIEGQIQDYIVKNPLEKEAVRQGFDKGVLGMMKVSSPREKGLMKRMILETKKGKKDPSYLGRATDVIGESVQDRIKYVYDVNQDAGKNVRKQAQALRGQKVDFEDVADDFFTRLQEGDLQIDFDENLVPNYRNSPVRNVETSKRVLNNISTRLKEIYEEPDAFKLHNLKKMIDEEVTFGKAGEGVKGVAERELKGLRSAINQRLADNFPEYGKANAIYSETIDALDLAQGLAGKKVNLMDDYAKSSLGGLSNRILTNYPSRNELLKTLNNVENISKKYGADFDDSIPRLVTFAEEIEDRFKAAPERSFKKQVAQDKAEKMLRASRDPMMTTVEAGVEGMAKLRGVDDESAYAAMMDVLNQ